MVDKNFSTIDTNCRTCFKKTKGLLSLSKSVDEGKLQQMSYADLLKDVVNIDINDDNSSEMPQYICGCCSRKLKSSHAFIKQAKEVNEKLLSLRNNSMFQDQKLNCLQECEVDINACLEIKIEPDDAYNEIYQEASSVAVEGKLRIKTELTDDISLNEQVDDESHINDGSHKNSSQRSSDTEPTTLHEPIEFDSDSPEKDGEVSECETVDEQWFTINIKNKAEKSEDSKEKTKRLAKANQVVNDSDIAVPCPQCKKIFINSKELNRHLRNTHVPEDQKCACPICGTKYSCSSNMHKHMRSMHDPESVKIFLPVKEKAYQCDRCHRKYTQRKHLNSHIRSKHSGGEESEKNRTIDESSIGGNKKPEVRTLCFVCGASFSKKADLIVHMRRHTGERPFKCDLCDRAFPRISALTCHRRIHTGEKPYKCKICDMSFRVSTKLASHMRSHSDERPYKCTECERSFKYSKDLNIHNRIHTGERPYCCTDCGSTFTQSNSLKAHRMKLGHMENNT